MLHLFVMCVCPYISIGVGNMGKPLLPAIVYNEFVKLVLSVSYNKYFKYICNLMKETQT